MRYSNLCIRFGTWKVRRLNRSRAKVPPKAKFPAALGEKNDWAVPNWNRHCFPVRNLEVYGTENNDIYRDTFQLLLCGENERNVHSISFVQRSVLIKCTRTISVCRCRKLKILWCAFLLFPISILLVRVYRLWINQFGEDRRSRYVTLPWYQNFWMTTNRKHHLRSEFALFQTSTILFNFI